ncbi:meiosis regulator and mRNA stability factor 1-like isoform X2 [Ruditapes philippinarum]|uniref:meiosis regulator and mRNA stability factor 1-like isoform X2 n=1 Tax=Ruditapes philippinarum TaxID=129788 RepID=UPI00295C3644|nr:meiosis regulator and mRNA stability factor 1-like isoform X2 [Ruditapes philippinarum]
MAKSDETSVCLPIGVFWDIENCCVPKWKSALLVVKAVREKLFNGHREVEFMCVCDTSKERKYIIQELNQAQVNVVHIDAVSKNAADDKLRQNIRRFADTHLPPARIVLISSDVNFSTDLYDLRYRKKFDIILIHSHHVHDSLIHSATENYLYEDLIKDIPCRSPSKGIDGDVELTVTGFPEDLDHKCVKSKLQKLSSNTGGRVVCVTDEYALLRFKTNTLAKRAKRRMDGQDFYGNKINVDFSGQGQYTENNNNNYSNRGQLDNRNNVSPNRTRPYSQSHRKNSPPKSRLPFPQPIVANEDNSYPSSGEVSPLDALLSGQLETITEDNTSGVGLQGLVKKFSQENKSSRQQQIYQEGQVPIGSESTQFYSQYTKYQETSYYGYSNHWQPQGYQDNRQYIDCYQPPQLYNDYNGSYYQYQNPQNPSPTYPYGNMNGPTTNNRFRPIRSASPSESSASSSPCDFNSEEYPGAVDLLISNLDYNISPREWKHILSTTFHPHIKILYIDVSLQPDNTSLGLIKVGSIEEARFAISQFHRKKIGYKRIHVTLKSGDENKTVSTVRSEAIALLSEAKDNVLPLFKFIELFNKRFNRSVSVAELYKMKDTIEIREQGGAGRMIHLAPELRKTEQPNDTEDGEVQEIIEQIVCPYHCPEGSTMYTEAVNTSILPNVKLQLKTFAPQVHSLLMTHDGDLPLLSFTSCFSVEVAPLVYVYEGGVPLEHLISCVPGVQIVVSPTGVKKVHWAENKPPNSPDLSRGGQQLAVFSKEIIDLLKSTPNCRLAFSKFIPCYHQHFGRQCRVADYGYNRLLDVFESIPHVLQVLGTGDRKVLTLTHRAQVKRFTADLIRLLKNTPGRMLYLSSLTEEFCKLFNKNWDIVEYGVCQLDDMLSDIPVGTVEILTEGHDTIIALPRKDQTPEEMERMKQFALEVVDLLSHSHQCHMLFNKFVPAYHHHFGHQCRVSDYGFTKLQDLFEALPKIVELLDEGEEKIIRLTEPELRKVIGDHIVSLLKQKKVQCYPLDNIMVAFTQHYGYTIPMEDLHVYSMEQLMAKLKHVLKVEVYDGKQYVVLSDRSSAPPLARQVLQLLMDQSGGSLPLMELCSRYKTTFGIDPDVQKIKEELLDYVQISGDDESGVISLTRLQVLARDIRVLLQKHGKMSLAQFERLFYEQYCVEIKPALYGFPTTVALLMDIPHVISIKGKGNRRMVHLSGDLQGSLPIIDESYTRPDSDTPSNDSGSALTDEDTPVEQRKFLPADLMSGSVPSNVPSPTLRPDQFGQVIDLIKFESQTPDTRDKIFSSITDDERSKQQTPLCQTPTSQLLQLAAQFLPTPPPTPVDELNSKTSNEDNATSGNEPKGNQPEDILNLIKQGWWRASPSQLQEVSESIKNAGLVEKMAQIESEALLENEAQSVTERDETGSHLLSSSEISTHTEACSADTSQKQDKNNNEKTKNYQQDYKAAINSLSATLSYLREQNEEQDAKTRAKDTLKENTANQSETKNSVDKSPIALCPRPLQPGSYWYSKQFQTKDSLQELPSNSSDEVRKVLAELAHHKPKQNTDTDSKTVTQSVSSVLADMPTPHASIDSSESFSNETITPDLSRENISKADMVTKNLETSEKERNKREEMKKLDDALEMEIKQTEQYVLNQALKSKTEKNSNRIFEHNFESCVAADCMCYEAVFRQDHPIETSSLRSDSSFTESPDSSPQKKILQRQQKLSSSTLSDESANSSINKRKSRIAAKFGQPLE